MSELENTEDRVPQTECLRMSERGISQTERLQMSECGVSQPERLQISESGDTECGISQPKPKSNFLRVSDYTLRPKKPKTVVKSPRKTKAEHQADYRKRLKTDPTRWDAYCLKQKGFLKNWRENQTPEQKFKEREKNRIRNTQARALKNMTGTEVLETPKSQAQTVPCTRASVAIQEMSLSKKREYWCQKQKKRRAQLTPEQRAELKARNRERYQRKKLLQDEPAFVPTSSIDTHSIYTPAVHTPSTHTPIHGTPTKAAKHNAVYRVKKSMPKNRKTTIHVLKQLITKASPSKKIVLRDLLKDELGLIEPHEQLPQQKEKQKRVSKESDTKTKIIKFFTENSVDLPGQRHYSKRLRKQRRILTFPIQTLLNKFRKDYPDVKVSLRNFFRCRPKYILSMKSQKFIQCLCEYCENCKLKLKVLKSLGAQFQHVKDALDFTMCPKVGEWWSPQCVSRKCNNCGVHLLADKLLTQCELRPSFITYKEWNLVFNEKYKVNRTELVHKESSVKDLINSFCSHLKDLSLHVFTSEWQRNQFISLKNDLPPDTSIIVVDFAENYTCRHQREVSAAHWSYHQVTVYPVVVYKRCSICSENMTSYHVFISDDLNHDSNFTFYVLKHVLSQTESSHFVIFSDNCGVQFKSKLPFYHMSKLANDFSFDRCYFGERHGKNECDSCGGMVKSFLSQAVASGRAILQNAEAIVNFLSSNMSLHNENCSHQNRTFHLLKESQINRRFQSSRLKTLPGTKKIHSFKVLSSQILAARQFSCFCEFCLQNSPNHCLNKHLISDFEKIKWPNAKSDTDNAKETPAEYNGNDPDANNDVVHDREVSVSDIVNGTESVCDDINENNNANVTHCREISNNECDSFVDVTAITLQEMQNVCRPNTNTNTSTSTITIDHNVESIVSNTKALSHECNSNGISNDFLDVAVLEESESQDLNNAVLHEDDSFDTSSPTMNSGLENSSELNVALLEDVNNDDLKLTTPNVRRSLFSPNTNTFDRKLFFKHVYQNLLNCSSFDEMTLYFQDVSHDFKKFDLMLSYPLMTQRNVDTTALQLLPANKPLGLLPALTLGDGNCMTRAISRLAFGHEDFHLEIRCRILAELCLNKIAYLDSDYVSIGCSLKKEKVLPLIALHSDCHDGRDTTSASVIEYIFEQEMFVARHLCKPLGIWQLLAASKVLNCCIISVYPEKGPKNIQSLFGRAMLPRGLDFNYRDVIYLMWSSTRVMNNEHWVANHVVPMLKIHK